MKWIEISKAKVKFGQLYLISPGPHLGVLLRSETTEKGIAHTFDVGSNQPDTVTATHIAIVTDPNADN
jgi:hypothetical protein